MSGGLMGDHAVSALGRHLHRCDVEVRRGVGVSWTARLGRPGSDRIVCGTAAEVGAAVAAYLIERGDAVGQ